MRKWKTFLFFSLFSAGFAYGEIDRDVPRNINPETRYVFYLHGRIIEDLGVRPKHPRYGYYEYEQILRKLEGRGFTVISEPRLKGTDPIAYSRKVVAQIQSLLASRVPPSHICVIGASKGGGIAMNISAGVKNPDVRYVFMGACNGDFGQYPKLTGEALSIYEESDEIGRSCKNVFSNSKGLSKWDEKQTHLGIAHGFLYRPFKEWFDPAVAWCQQ